MGNQIRPYGRRAQILRLLYDYGVMSSTGIRFLLEPPITRRKLCTALDRLKQRKLIYRRANTYYGDHIPFYGLHPRQQAQMEIASILKADPALYRRPLARYEEDTRCQMAGVWAQRFKLLLPEAAVVHRVRFPFEPTSQPVFPEKEAWLYRRATLLITIPGKASERPVNILARHTFHIGKTPWPTDEIRLYASNPHIDGVILYCEPTDWPELMQSAIRTRWRTERVKHYADYFVMFAEDHFKSLSDPVLLTNRRDKTLNLEDWLRLVREVSAQDRANPPGPVWAPSGPSCEVRE
ncbi:MAG: hypothetical protein ACXVCS_15375 [Bdellovibrionota bacterium]